MRGIVIASVAALLMGAASANAQENSVYINLSALDALDAEPAAEPAAPLFPVIKAQPKKAPAAKIRPAKAKKKTVRKPAPKVEVKVVETVKAQPAKEDKPAQIPYVDNTEEVIVVDVEPVTADKVAAPAEKPAAENKPAIENAEDNAPAVVPADVPAAQPVAEPALAVVTQPEPETAQPETAAPESLLVNPQETLPQAGAKIVFVEGESELSDSHKAQIDGIVNTFADAANNKIAIYSYNLDDGVDSFKKKRQSLNRAVEVRSYLLQKGYKNFSIKVLNVDGSSDKINSVELEELK